MGVLQRSVDHTLIGRAIADKTLQARNPQLIKLPLPLPSIPVLTPLLSPLIGGSNDNPKPATTTTTPASPPPAQTPPSSSSGSSGGNNGGGNGGSGGSSGSTSSGSGNTGSSPPPSSGNSGSSSSSSSGSGSSNSPPPSSGDSSSSSSSSGTTPSGDSPTSGDGDGSSGTSPSGSTPSGSTGSTPSSASSSSSSGNNVDDQSSGIGGSSILSSASGNGTNTSDSSSLGGAPVGVANAGSIPGSESSSTPGSSGPSGSSGSSGSGASGSHSTGTTIVGGASSPSFSQGTSGGTNPGAVGGTGTAAAQTGGKHGLSGGVIAVIVMVLLFLLVASLIFCVRRRTRAKRDERANRWWFSRKRDSQTYGDRDSPVIWAAGGAAGSGARSARSSFATTVDHSISTRPRSSEFVIPPLPPMAEVGRANGTVPTLILDTSHFVSANANVNGQPNDPRFSIGSNHSNNSENSNAQYLVVHHRDSLANPDSLGTPMSVRPFSPSESFAFPRPPDPVGDRTSAYSRLSNGTLAAAASKSSPTAASFHLSGEIPPTPALPTLMVSPTPITTTAHDDANADANAYASNAISNDPFADNNPFDDPAAATSNASTGEFADVEYIRRPFYPTLPDELAVRPDDTVRVLQAFDDGWALVEKVAPDRKGKGKEAATPGVGEQGLIPVDCLREPGQDLTTFIAAKRLSSYADSVDVRNSVTAI